MEDTYVVTSDAFVLCSGATNPTSPPYPGDEAGVIEGDSKKSESHAHVSGDVGVVGVELTPD